MAMGYDRDEYRTKQPQDFISMLYPELRKEFKDCAVLDVGCGRGAVSLSIAPYLRIGPTIIPCAEGP